MALGAFMIGLTPTYAQFGGFGSISTFDEDVRRLIASRPTISTMRPT